MQCDTVWKKARLMTAAPALIGLGVIDDGVVAARDGRIIYAGPAVAAPEFQAQDVIDCEHRLVTPGLIDAHTHLIYAGDRSHEFKQRLAGVSYEEIARSGGGILSTMKATRQASEETLIKEALPRLDSLLSEGMTTIEIKSGYGLSLEAELKSLRAAKALARHRSVRVLTTFLGAHAVPPEFIGHADDYIEAVCTQMIPAVAHEGLASAVDVFCEGIGFSLSQTEKVFAAAQAHGLRVKLHTEQLSNQHGAELAARYGALSNDHLEYLDAAGIAAMKASGTVALLLPGAFYFTRETQKPPIAALRAAGIAMALATDCNPGTSPLTSLLLTMNMAATLFSMTVEEVWLGVTREAARALGRPDDLGTLEAGKVCDLAIWNVHQPETLVYALGLNPLHARVFEGQTFASYSAGRPS